MESGSCLAAIELPASPATLAYSPDGNLLVALLQDRSVLAFYGGGLADRSVLLPSSARGERVQQGFHVAITAVGYSMTSFDSLGPAAAHWASRLQYSFLVSVQGSKPLVFMSQHRGSSVRVVYSALPDGAKPGDLKQGLQLKPDRKAPIIGLAAHPTSMRASLPPHLHNITCRLGISCSCFAAWTESQLLVLFADGVLCGSTVNERVLTTVWSVPVGEHPVQEN